MFTYRITDNHLIVICATLERYAIYIEEIDLRYNQITDIGAKALGDLISKSPRLASLASPLTGFLALEGAAEGDLGRHRAKPGT